MEKTIGLLVGSLRKESFSGKIARALLEMTPPGFAFKVVSLADLPIYNADFDTDGQPPASYTAFREEASRVDGLIFITPEYNRSVPAVLKNALDIGSRPVGKNVWKGKPAMVISHSPGSYGGFGANHHLRQCLVPLNVPAMPAPELYLAKIAESFDESGMIKDGATKELLKKGVDAYVEWCGRFYPLKAGA